MHRPGVQAKKLAIEQVRQPGERVPVGEFERREGPANRFGRQPAVYHRVVQDIGGVVKIDEIEVSHPTVDNGRYRDERQADPESRRDVQAGLRFAFPIPHSPFPIPH